MLKISFLALSLFATVTFPNALRAEVVDPRTWDIIAKIVRDHPNKFFTNRLEIVDTVSLGAVEITANPDARNKSNDTIEITSQVFNAVNCSDRDQTWERDIDTTEVNKLTVTIRDAIKTTEKTSVNIGGNLFGTWTAKLDASKETVIDISTTQVQEISETKVVRLRERRTITPRTRLYIRLVTRVEQIQVPISGSAVIDARVFVPVENGTWMTLSGQLRRPHDRMVYFSGLGVLTEAETIDIIYEERRIPPGDPVCNVEDPPDLRSLYPVDRLDRRVY